MENISNNPQQPHSDDVFKEMKNMYLSNDSLSDQNISQPMQ